jgi:hypothetical protein
MKIKAPEGRVIISVDLESKNSHRFENGTQIRLERQYNNFNKRETEPVNATVIDAEGIPAGSEMLIHHNATHETFKINNLKSLSGSETASSVKYYSILSSQCYAHRPDKDSEWMPMKHFAFALRVFQPYEGIIAGIEPKKIPQALYILTGEFAGKVVKTLKACDYEIIYQGDDGREKRLIRCRHFEDGSEPDREEILFVDPILTDKLYDQEILIGLSSQSAKPLEISAYAD